MNFRQFVYTVTVLRHVRSVVTSHQNEPQICAPLANVANGLEHKITVDEQTKSSTPSK